MHARSWTLAAGFVLAGTIAPVSAMADVTWSGAGWYLRDYANDFFGGFISGPYSSEADCKTALSTLPQDKWKGARCDYFPNDPDKN